MPPHPDRVRRNYEDNKRMSITFKGIPIHTCDKIPREPGIVRVRILDAAFNRCPYCLEKIKDLDA